jgi:hypothetical protein
MAPNQSETAAKINRFGLALDRARQNPSQAIDLTLGVRPYRAPSIRRRLRTAVERRRAQKEIGRPLSLIGWARPIIATLAAFKILA